MMAAGINHRMVIFQQKWTQPQLQKIVYSSMDPYEEAITTTKLVNIKKGLSFIICK